ncbi:MAG: hypothetical protein OEM32_00820 [Acidimicrobiia bacterium]|nr:hypothetical protein [Acidimicrobiia bacterium]
MKKMTALALFAAAMAAALPALALDARCETEPNRPMCQVEPPPPPTTIPEPPATPLDAVSVVGCSNTHHAVTGYLEESSVDLLVNTAYAGHTMTVWATDPLAWEDHYLPQRPANGFDGAWLNLCERASSGLTLENVEAVISKIWEIDPEIPIWVSPHNFYANEDCEVTNGNQISDEGAAIAEIVVESYINVFRGPDLGPLTADMLRRDSCHQNDSGVAFNGSQLVDFFDASTLVVG